MQIIGGKLVANPICINKFVQMKNKSEIHEIETHAGGVDKKDVSFSEYYDGQKKKVELKMSVEDEQMKGKMDAESPLLSNEDKIKMLLRGEFYNTKDLTDLTQLPKRTVRKDVHVEFGDKINESVKKLVD